MIVYKISVKRVCNKGGLSMLKKIGEVEIKKFIIHSRKGGGDGPRL